MFDDLKIIYYPDPRLKKVSAEVTSFDDRLKALAAKMLELMKAAKGVGLAAPQVGENIRLFVMNPTGEPGDDRVYVNPVLSEAAGEDEDEEGCLSLPEIRAQVLRSKAMRMDAKAFDGKPFSETQTGYVARVWQHETDHLNGVLLLDRMGPVAKMAARKILRDLEEQYAAEHGKGKAKPVNKKLM
jgi:peptide deformylase